MVRPIIASQAGDVCIIVAGVLGSPEAGETVTLDVTSGAIVYKWTAGEAETVVVSGAHCAGQRIVCLIGSDATPRTITFGTGFKPTATFATTSSKYGTVSFISDGTNFWETGRSEAKV